MFNGPQETVTLTFDDALINAMFDKFGEDIPMERVDEHTCRVTVPVRVSPIFFGWVFQFGDLMRVTGPEGIVKEYLDWARKACGEDHEG